MAAASDRDSILSSITDPFDLWRIVNCLGENLKQILQSISSDETLQMLHLKDSETCATILHIAVCEPDAKAVERLLECVSEEERYILLCAQDRNQFTPIHYPCFHDNNRVLGLMNRLLKEETLYKLLQITSASGSTPLHVSALRGNTQAITAIADSLTALQLIHLLRITDDYGRTPLQWAEYYGKHAAAELLQNYQTKALIDVALQQADQTGSNSTPYITEFFYTFSVSNFPSRLSLIAVFDYSFYGV